MKRKNNRAQIQNQNPSLGQPVCTCLSGNTWGKMKRRTSTILNHSGPKLQHGDDLWGLGIHQLRVTAESSHRVCAILDPARILCCVKKLSKQHDSCAFSRPLYSSGSECPLYDHPA